MCSQTNLGAGGWQTAGCVSMGAVSPHIWPVVAPQKNVPACLHVFLFLKINQTSDFLREKS